MGGFIMGNLSRLNLYFVDLIAYYLCFVLYDAKKYSRPLVTLFMIALFVFCISVLFMMVWNIHLLF